MKEFSLKNLIVKNEDKIIFDVNFTRSDSVNRTSLLSTVIIGENGTGKSHLLSTIVDVFRFLNSYSYDIRLKYSYYEITYSLNGNIYNIIIEKNHIVDVLQNDNSIVLQHIDLPQKQLAVSFMVNDKFTFLSPNETKSYSTYKYLGVRRTSNASWTNSLEMKISELLISNFHNKQFQKKLKEILKFMNFQPKISLIFHPTRKDLLIKGLETYQLNHYLEKEHSRNNFRNNILHNYTYDDLRNIEHFIDRKSKSIATSTSQNHAVLEYDLTFDSDNDLGLSSDYDILTKLINLRLLRSPILKLYKNDDFDFEHTSSGEKHLLFTLISLASEIEDNSIILIDEPEISLHPNWQINYINNLKELFYDYPSCHFIIATHSHYLVSDLEPNSSSLIHLMFEKQKNQFIRVAKLLEINTYALSAENVLYNVFGVRTTRNHYFEIDLKNLVSLITENSKDINKITALLNKVKNYSLDKNDPLHILIEEVERYLKNVKSNK